MERCIAGPWELAVPIATIIEDSMEGRGGKVAFQEPCCAGIWKVIHHCFWNYTFFFSLSNTPYYFIVAIVTGISQGPARQTFFTLGTFAVLWIPVRLFWSGLFCTLDSVEPQYNKCSQKAKLAIFLFYSLFRCCYAQQGTWCLLCLTAFQCIRPFTTSYRLLWVRYHKCLLVHMSRYWF